VTVLHDVAAVAAGSYHSLFLKKDGNVVAAGNNEDGQLGDGSTTNRHRPVRAKVPQWKIERGDWTQIMCHNGGTFQTVITASSHFESSNAVEASAEIGMEMKLTESAAPFGAGVSAEQTVSPTASATYARLFFEETEHGITATVRCPTSGCLFQYQMRMYQEYGSGTCHWKTQMTTCTKNTAPPGCPPFIPDCKLVGAYMVTDNLQEARRGATKMVWIKRMVVDEHGCQRQEEQEVPVTVPVGCQNKHRITLLRLSNEEPGKVPGDYTFVIKVNAEQPASVKGSVGKLQQQLNCTVS